MNETPYSREYSPAAPVIQIKLAIPGEVPEATSLTALVDTGADGTFVPTAILEEMELPIVYMTNVIPYLGDRPHRVSVHMVDFILNDTTRLPNIEVIADDWGENMILGRNILNKLQLQLDGPNETTTLLA